MKRDTKITIVIVVAAVLLLGAKLFFLWGLPEAAAQQENWLTYEDALFGMKISYPENWTREDGPNGVTLTAPNGVSNLIFTFGVDYSPGTGTAKSEIRDFVDILRRGGVPIRVLEANFTTVGGWLADRATYTYTDVNGNDPHTNTQIVVVKDSDLYRLHYSAPSSEWDRLLPTFEKMVESVEITN